VTYGSSLTVNADGEPCPMMSERNFDIRWYAVQTRSRHEKTASEQLRARQIQTFLPLYTVVRRWKNGDHQVELPLFPGYTFVRIPLKDRLHVLKVHGVARLVGFNGAPTPVDDNDIQSLQCALSSGMKTGPHPYVATGRRVRITAGPLVGYEGILLRRKGVNRVVLSVRLIQRSVVIDIDACEVEPA
jgi:transcription antitermination factor NusG